jgi:hypothetical protein
MHRVGYVRDPEDWALCRKAGENRQSVFERL